MPPMKDEEDVLTAVALQNAQSILSVHRRAEESFRKQSELLRVTFASIGDAVISTDAEGRVAFVNGVAEELTGWCQAEAVGRPLTEIFHIVNEQSRQPIENPALRALREGIIVRLANHTVLIAHDGTERHIEDRAAPIHDELDQIVGCVLVFRDISERRRNEKRLAQINEEARRVLDLNRIILANMAEGLYTIDAEGCVTYVNPAAERMLGWASAELLGRRMHEITHHSHSDGRPFPAQECSERHVMQTGTALVDHEDQFLRKDGSFFWVCCNSSPIRSGEKTVGVVVVFRDTTEQKRAEEEAREREQFIKRVLDTSPGILYVFDLESRGVVFINERVTSMIGMTPRQIVDARERFLTDRVHPEDLAVLNEHLGRLASLADGEVRGVEYRMQHPDGRWLWFRGRDTVFQRTAEGKPRLVMGVASDITERKQSEDHLRQMAADLSEGDRRKNEFMAMLAHELRNPLAPICTALQILRASPGDRETVQTAAEMMNRQVGHMVRLVDDLLDVSRISRGRIELRWEQVELASVIAHAVETCRPALECARHQLHVKLPPQSVYLRGDRARLAQAFSNLLNNACKYTGEGGQITLSAERDGADLLVSLKDSGVGISSDMLPKIFEMFTQADRSLERSQGGLGIGLTLVQRLVDMHGGTVHALSEGPGKGSEFVVRLPIVSDQQASSSPGPIVEEPAPMAGRRILIVDDNKDTAASLAILLKLAGNETHTAHDGLAAVEAALAFRPDMVLLDLGLPKLNGYEAARRIRAKPGGKDLLLVALTGWGQEEDRKRSREAGFNAHLVKPVDLSALQDLFTRH